MRPPAAFINGNARQADLLTRDLPPALARNNLPKTLRPAEMAVRARYASPPGTQPGKRKRNIPCRVDDGPREGDRQQQHHHHPMKHLPLCSRNDGGSSMGKRSLKRNACNSHLIPKMDGRTCHGNPPQQNAPPCNQVRAIKRFSWNGPFLPFGRHAPPFIHPPRTSKWSSPKK